MLSIASNNGNIISIESDSRVRFTELGTGGKGVVWDVDPGNFTLAIDMVNSRGGRDAWRIEQVGL